MWWRRLGISFTIGLCLALCSSSALIAEDITCAGSDVAEKIVRAVFNEYVAHSPGGVGLRYLGGGTYEGLRALCESRAEVAVTDRRLVKEDLALLAKGFRKGTEQPEQLAVCRAAIVFAVPKACRTTQLTIAQVTRIFQGQIDNWAKVGGPKKKIIRFAPRYSAISGWYFRRALIGHQLFGEHLRACDNDPAVISEVAGTPDSIGVCLLPFAMQDKEVNFVSIASEKGAKGVPPMKPEVLFDEYPMVFEIRLFIHPRASRGAKDFSRYAVSKDVVKTIEGLGLLPSYEKQKVLMERRLAAMRAGKGVRIRAVGARSGQGFMQDLAVEYVKAKQVVQMRYAPAGETSSVGYFLSGNDLVLLNGSPGKEAMRVHGARWRALKPAEHVLGGRAVAVIVHALNKLESLTLDQVRAVFSGEVRNWRVLAAAEAEVHRYGLKRPDPAADLFHKKVLGVHRLSSILLKKGTAEVVSALSIDPQGIAFVNFAEIPPENEAVKVLAIGRVDKAVRVTTETILDGSYALGERLMLYVSPKASETAKDFVKFMLADKCAETFRRHGLVTRRPEPTTKPREQAQAAAR